MENYKVALIGAGAIGVGAHIPAYRRLKGIADVVAVVDKSAEKAEYASLHNQIPHWYTDVGKMLEECRPDIVSVCTPNLFHKDISIQALRAGAHVICEKPVALTLRDVSELYWEAKCQGRKFLVTQTTRIGVVQEAKRLFEAGCLGEVYHAELSFVLRRGIPHWGEFHIKSSNGGGPLSDMGIHALDAAMYILGNPAFRAASAQAWSKIGNSGEKLFAERMVGQEENPLFLTRKYAQEEFSVEDHCAGIIRCNGGLMLSFKFSWALNCPDQTELVLYGDKGGIKINILEDAPVSFYHTRQGYLSDEYVQMPFSQKEMIDNKHNIMIKHFVDVIAGRTEPMVREEEVCNTAAMVEASYLSAQKGREVTAEELGKFVVPAASE